ncbi:MULTISPECIES: carotenoid oxygenase family protein [Actinomadura]|uniref:Dioxygenase n=1 Tax=Actinomadura yumaensis TaxID=111807 RepID=A0ABW2CZW6_9ACTN|nr:carotenoid oxygenase family protein [Actinomadura sp. J1-007]MWK38942.1 carotenoid oxygenase [Actinomadura sp. J1-007]
MAREGAEDRFQPVLEERTVTDLEVTGTIPAHLDGRYARIGPNRRDAGDHLFLGDGMAHGVRLRDGRAEWYRNRWIRTGPLARALGERPRPGRRFAGMDYAVNTNVIQHGGRTLALVEAGTRPYELTPELETVGVCDFDGTLPGGYTAHPHRDPATGELHAVSYFFGWGNRVQYSVLTAAGRVRRLVDIEVTGSPMMHDFSLTENHVILYDLPVTFAPEVVTRGMPSWMARPTRSVLSRTVGHLPIPEWLIAGATRLGATDTDLPYRWDPSYPARVGVLPRSGGSDDVRWFEIEPCFVFHPLNAYEEDGTIVLDVVRHPRMFDTRRDPHEGGSTLDRWTIDLAAGTVADRRLDDHHQEFPRINEALTGRPHRYGYGVAASGDDLGDGLAFDTVVKHDLAAEKTHTHHFGATRYADEFVFVPDENPSAEDDGVLMGYVYDRETGRSDLTFLDARSLDLVAAVHLPVRVPAGFHGNWMPA